MTTELGAHWRGVHTGRISGETIDRRLDRNERFTPSWVFDGLGMTFDLDPASPIGGGDHVPARCRLTTYEDGLASPWHGLVWLNPPFSAGTAWGDRFREHADGVFLGPVANARWWIDLALAADAIWHCRDFAFDHPTHAGKRSSMPLAFVAIGIVAVAGLRRLASSGLHPGVLVLPDPSTSKEGMMPRQTTAATPSTPPTQTKRGGGGIDWKKFGAREADDGDRLVWRAANEGDTMTGTLGRVDEATTRFGSKVVLELDDCRAVIAGGVEEVDGDYTVWPTPGLVNAFADAQVGKGDRVLITLDELIDTGKGNPFKRFSVEVLDPQSEPF